MSKKNLLSLFIIAFVFTLDRVSKFTILELSKPEGQLNIEVASFINFNLVWNEGIAFGLLSFSQSFYYQTITILIILITLLIMWFAYKTKGYEKLGFLLISGGSLGNIFDRVYYSAVIDFIDLNYNNFHWFIFNVADMFIFIGVVILLSLEVTKKNKV